MIQRKKKICKCGCGKEGYIYARGLLLDCDRRENPHKHGGLKKGSPPLKRSPIKKKKKEPSGELVLFEALWEVRERVSFISGIPLGVTMSVNFFAHVLSKAPNKYPKFKLYDKNIAFLTAHEHTLLDHSSEDKRQKYAEEMKSKGVLVDWNKLYTLREELKREYEQLVVRGN